MREELAYFDAGLAEAPADGGGGGDDHDGDWVEDALEEVLRLLGECLPQWLDGAPAHGRDLLLPRDGGR
ncbi:hypothetical protein [Kitasatospora sp. NPDC086791]|uniref:hypothetical protein n=1 Tax=Kitasatospora sp. NPDC086791 TaxID=3155178 RepID=UPI003415430D